MPCVKESERPPAFLLIFDWDKNCSECRSVQVHAERCPLRSRTPDVMQPNIPARVNVGSARRTTNMAQGPPDRATADRTYLLCVCLSMRRLDAVSLPYISKCLLNWFFLSPPPASHCGGLGDLGVHKRPLEKLPSGRVFMVSKDELRRFHTMEHNLQPYFLMRCCKKKRW